MQITIITSPASAESLRQIAKENFSDMIKGVVDIHLKILALGGELHADAEAALLERGSKQEHLWGFNLYPGKTGDDRVEFTSFINIRPAQGNRSIEIQNRELKVKIRGIIDSLAGE